MQFNALIEEWPGESIAYFRELPGCYCSAPTYGALLKIIPASIADYVKWVKANDITILDEFDGQVEVVIKEHLVAEHGKIGPLFEADLAPPDGRADPGGAGQSDDSRRHGRGAVRRPEIQRRLERHAPAGGHWQEKNDVDGDGWADLAGYSRAVGRPRLFWDNTAGATVCATGGVLWAGSQSASNRHRGGTLTLLTRVWADTFDPVLTQIVGGALNLSNDGLTAYQRVGGSGSVQVVPDLAVSYPSMVSEYQAANVVIPLDDYVNSAKYGLTQAEQDDFLKVKGLINKYKNRFQLTIHKLRKLGELEIEFDDYLPKTTKNIDELWQTLGDFVATFQDPHLKGLVRAFMSDPDIAAAYRSAPAAKTLHHAYIGGLLDHVVSLFKSCDLVCRNYPQVNRDLLLTGVFLHDVGKVHELTYNRSFSYPTRG